MPAPPPPNVSRNPLRAFGTPKAKAPPPPPNSENGLGTLSQPLEEFIRGPKILEQSGASGGNYAIRLYVGRVIKEGVPCKTRKWARKKPEDEQLNFPVSIKFNASIQMAVITEFNENTNLRVTIPFSELGSVIVSGNPQLRFMSSRDAFTMLVGFVSDKVRDEVHELTCAVRSCGTPGLELFQALDPGFTGSVPTHAVANILPRHLLEEHRVRQALQNGYAQHTEISFWHFIVMLAGSKPRHKNMEDSRPSVSGEEPHNTYSEEYNPDSPLSKWVQARLAQVQSEQATKTEFPVSVPMDFTPSPSETSLLCSPIKPESKPESEVPKTPLKKDESFDNRNVRARTLRSPTAPAPPPTLLERYSTLTGEVVLHQRAYGEVRFIYRNYPRLTAEELKNNAGGLLLTNYGFVFVPPLRTMECVCIPFGNINIVELEQDTLILTTKDILVYKWTIATVVSEDQPKPGESPAESTFKVLYNLSFPIDLNLLFAFTSARSAASSSEPRRFCSEALEVVVGGPAADGWLVYNPIKEFDRLGLLRKDHTGSSMFRPYYNKNGRLCATYPSLFLVPNILTDADLIKVSGHRSKGRVPAVVYLHPSTGATLTRCSQPFVGVKGFVGGGNRCPEEEKLIESLLSSNPTNQKTLYFVDLRGNTAASGNQLMGKGTEHVSYYRNAQLKFMGIGNIHAVRSAYEKLATLCHSDTTSLTQGDNDWDKKFYETHWLHHVRTTLNAASQMVTILEVEGASIVSHCSDGWDRTPSVISLVEILLDPFFRTKRGFAILIEKEWCSFGHKFAERLGQGQPNHTSDQRSPIFLQWLDCIFQVWRQHQQEFEFTEDFLLAIASELTSCRYGTFLYDTELERIEEDVRGRTASLWTDLLNEKAYPAFSNQNFHPTRITLTVDYMKRLVLWERYWLRLEPTKAPRQSRLEREKALKEIQQQQKLADLWTKYHALEGFIKEQDASVDIAAITQGSQLRRPRLNHGAASANTSPTRTPTSPTGRPRSGSAGTAVEKMWLAGRSETSGVGRGETCRSCCVSCGSSSSSSEVNSKNSEKPSGDGNCSSSGCNSGSDGSMNDQIVRNNPRQKNKSPEIFDRNLVRAPPTPLSAVKNNDNIDNSNNNNNNNSDSESNKNNDSSSDSNHSTINNISDTVLKPLSSAPLSPSSGHGTMRVALSSVGEESETREKAESVITITQERRKRLSVITGEDEEENTTERHDSSISLSNFPELEDASSPPASPPSLAPASLSFSSSTDMSPSASSAAYRSSASLSTNFFSACCCSPASSSAFVSSPSRLVVSSLCVSSPCASSPCSSPCASSPCCASSSCVSSSCTSSASPLASSSAASSCTSSSCASPSTFSSSASSDSSSSSCISSLSHHPLPAFSAFCSPSSSRNLASPSSSDTTLSPSLSQSAQKSFTLPSALTSPALTSPALTSPALTSPASLTSPALTSPASLTSPALTSPALTSFPLSPASQTLLPLSSSMIRSPSFVRPPPPPNSSLLMSEAPTSVASSLDSWDSDSTSTAPESARSSVMETTMWDSTLDLWDFSQRNSVSTTMGSLVSLDSARNSTVLISSKHPVGGSPVKITSNQSTHVKTPPPPPSNHSTLRKAATFAATLRARLDKPSK